MSILQRASAMRSCVIDCWATVLPNAVREVARLHISSSARTAFGKTVAQQTVTQERIAEARCKIDMARLLTLKAAWLMDVAGNKVAKTEIAMIKVVAPSMACQVIDWAMQVHGGGGMCDDFPLAYAYAGARTLRFADGPDEVHRNAIAKWELGKYGSYGKHADVPVTRGS